MRGHRSNSQRGFNLVEVMMATAILLVGFVAVIQAVTIVSVSLDTARKQQVAIQIAATEIEKLRTADWSVVAALPATASVSIDRAGLLSGDTTYFDLANRTVDPADDNTKLCALARGFTCSLTRTYLRPSGATSSTMTFMKVVYTVAWTTNTGRVQRHHVDTYLTKSGLHLSYQQS